VLNKSDFSPRALLMPSTATIVQEVNTNAYSIGYGGVAYAQNAGVKIVKIKKDSNSPAIYPADEAITSGVYPIARPLLLYTNGEPGGLVKKFIDFSLTPEGQKIVLETGYVPMK
jgi:phosphate transport system substrate-binding protein